MVCCVGLANSERLDVHRASDGLPLDALSGKRAASMGCAASKEGEDPMVARLKEMRDKNIAAAKARELPILKPKGNHVVAAGTVGDSAMGDDEQQARFLGRSRKQRRGKKKKNAGQRKRTICFLGLVALMAERELESFCTLDGKNELSKLPLSTPDYAMLT